MRLLFQRQLGQRNTIGRSMLGLFLLLLFGDVLSVEQLDDVVQIVQLHLNSRNNIKGQSHYHITASSAPASYGSQPFLVSSLRGAPENQESHKTSAKPN